ncbi:MULTISPECIES: DNA adenine methylase [unclassified Achromobacter]|uniref:DNA adenine methylase n=1 Tax=unclassified Achromobacter TaxID=2626865 RepID=UPI000B514ED1|nr:MULTISPECIES: DNA adenine methylase [unclassified Achromobacter]OWT75439.1 DNA methyltransferase [Achromobacter sp. HZ28]OWT76099.1 DNA methyltransferase [Achromobacter sp. HZ34]
MQFSTPLRYPGGKARLGSWLAELLRHNKLSGGQYVEPYAGGAGAAIFLLSRGYVDSIVLNDADPAVHTFWKVITQDSKVFIEMVEATPVTMESWYVAKEVLACPEQHSDLAIAFSTFFLNRTNRSGILSAGVIGGKQQTGNYKLDARYQKADLVARLKQIGALAGRIEINGLDAMEFVGSLRPSPKTLVYLDPPYYEKGSCLYRNFYEPEDHQAIAERVGQLDIPWLVTYDNCPPIRDLYAQHHSAEFSMVYSTSLQRPVGSEIMFFSGLSIHCTPFLKR